MEAEWDGNGEERQAAREDGETAYKCKTEVVESR